MANLLTTIETPTMQINSVVTETKLVEKTVSLPYYFKDEYSNLCKVIDETHYLAAKSTVGFWCIQTYPVKLFKDRIAQGTPITEIEFENAYDNALLSIQALKDNLEPSTEVDDNVQIDEILERRAS